MKELVRSTWNNTHNISVPVKHVSDILQLEEAFTVEEYKHTHTRKLHSLDETLLDAVRGLSD